MKILHFIYDDLGNPWLGGGGAVATYFMYTSFPADCEITVVTAYYRGAKRIEQKGNIKYLRVGSARSYLLSRITYTIAAVRHLLKARADIIAEIFSPYSPVFLPFLASRKPYVIIFQNIFDKEVFKTRGLLGLVPYLIERFYLKKVRSMVVVSEKLKKMILDHNFSYKLMEKIYNGVEKELYDVRPAEKNYILYLGRYDIYQKGLDLLVNAFDKVAGEFKDVMLVLAGSGKDRLKLMKAVGSSKHKDSITVLERTEGQQKVKALQESLFVCVPSRFEALGIVAEEALACGKPVLGTRIKGLEEIVIDGINGILVEPNSVDALAEGMRKLLRNKPLRERLGKEGREFAVQFRWDKVSARYNKFFGKLFPSIKNKTGQAGNCAT